MLQTSKNHELLRLGSLAAYNSKRGQLINLHFYIFSVFLPQCKVIFFFFFLLAHNLENQSLT